MTRLGGSRFGCKRIIYFSRVVFVKVASKQRGSRGIVFCSSFEMLRNSRGYGGERSGTTVNRKCQSNSVTKNHTLIFPEKAYPRVAYLYFMITLASSFGELGLLPSFSRAFNMAVKTLSLASSG